MDPGRTRVIPTDYETEPYCACIADGVIAVASVESGENRSESCRQSVVKMATDALGKIEKLRGSANYSQWRVAMKASLVLAKLWKCVSMEQVDEKDVERDEMAQARIVLNVESHLYTHIEKLKTSREMWLKLEKVCGGDGLGRRIQLMRKLVQTQLNDCKDIGDYVEQKQSVVKELQRIKFEVSDEWAATFLLAGLPEAFEPMIMALENSGKPLNLEEIEMSLLNRSHDVKTETALAVRRASKSKADSECYSCGKKGHFASECRGNKAKKCYVCHKPGHVAADCNTRKKQDRGGGGGSTFFAGLAEEQALLTNRAAEPKATSWIIDSGATVNMSWSKTGLVAANGKRSVVTASGESMPVVGEVKQPVKLIVDGNAKPWFIEGLCVPGLRVNLLSVRSIMKKGFDVMFRNGECVIEKNGERIAVARDSGQNFVLDTVEELQANLVSTRDAEELWHRRLGHLCPNYMRAIKEKIGKIDVKDCVTCAMGKITRMPFPSSQSKTTKVLQLIHSDVMGPVRPVSRGGKRYVVTFIDDYSRKVFVRFLKTKDDVFEAFKDFKALVELQTGEKIKILRTDGGGEYVNGRFARYIAEAGIVHQRTTARCPEQNGVAERVNRTLVTRARCMMIDAGLEQELWAEALNTATYLVNRSPNCAVGMEIPEERFAGKKVSLKHLRVFGSKCVVEQPKDKRRKFEPTGKRGVLIGYSEESKAYRVLIGGSVRVERNVKVFETRSANTKMPEESFGGAGAQWFHEDNADDGGVVADDDVIVHDNADDGGDSAVFGGSGVDGAEGSGEGDGGDVSQTDSQIDSDEYMSFEDRREASEDEVDDGVSAVRRSERAPKPLRLQDYVYTCGPEDPASYNAALKSPERNEWLRAMKREMESLKNYQTWELVDRPKDKKVIKNRWVYQSKEGTEKAPFKARLVVKGYMQDTKGVELFSPVVRYDTIRTMMCVAANKRMIMSKFDVSTAFLNGRVKEEVYMEQPEGFNDNSGKVCKLKKALYGLKQSPRCWSEEIERFFNDQGFHSGEADPCLFHKKVGNESISVILYVDDGLVFTTCEKLKTEFIRALKKKFKITTEDHVKSFLGIKIVQSEGRLAMSHPDYIEKMVEKFRLRDATTVESPMQAGWEPVNSKPFTNNTLYREVVGQLLYIHTVCRPDIGFPVSVLSRELHAPTIAHWELAKRVIRYLKGTKDIGIVFQGKMSLPIVGYSDADYGGN